MVGPNFYRRMYKNAHLIGLADSPPPPKAACAHLGPMTRTQMCKACRGTVRIKVLVCEIHGECTMRKQADGVAGRCSGCADYTAAAAAAAG